MHWGALARVLSVAVLCLCAFALGRAWPSTAAAEGAAGRRRFRNPHVHGGGRQGRGAQPGVPRQRDGDVRAPRHEQRGVLHSAGRPRSAAPPARTSPSGPRSSITGPCEWSRDTLIYVLGHASRAAAEENWASFAQDEAGMRSFREDYARRRRQGDEDRVGVHGRHRVLRTALAASRLALQRRHARASSLSMRPSTRRISRRARVITRGSCVENRNVTPCSRFRVSIMSSSAPAVAESMLAVGSSASTIAGPRGDRPARSPRAAAARPRAPGGAAAPVPRVPRGPATA